MRDGSPNVHSPELTVHLHARVERLHGTAGVLRVWPVHGRSKARINVKVYGDAGAAADVRLTAISYGGASASMNEVPLTNLTNIVADAQQTFLLDLHTSWLILHADISAGAPTIQWTMAAA